MPRWIAFDQKTLATLRDRIPGQQVYEHAAHSIVEYAEGGNAQTLVAVLPTQNDDQAAVAVFRRRSAAERTEQAEKSQRLAAAAPSPLPPRERAVSTEARKSLRPGGVLGLRDDLWFVEERPPEPPKSWWRRFWDDEED